MASLIGLDLDIPFAGGIITVPTWLIISVIGAAIVLTFLYGWFGNPRGRGAGEDLDRERNMSGKWARAGDVKELLVRGLDARRLRLGLLGRTELAAPPFRSKLVLAPTGSGKTPRVIVPDVLLHEGPAVVASVKGDILHLTHHAREQAGPVWIFDPSGATGLPTCRWSPLTGLDTYAAAYSAARWLCESSKVEKRGLENQQYWDTMGRRMLAPMLYAAAASDLAMTEVVRWVQTTAEAEVEQLLADLGDRSAIHAWQSHIDTVDRTKSSIYGTAWEILESWGHPDMAAGVDTTLLPGPDIFDTAELLSTGGTLYMVAPTSDQAMFTPVFETLTNAILRTVEIAAHRRGGLPLDPPLLLALDEAANIAPLRRLDQVATKGAGEGVKLVTAWQDEGQIIEIYGADRGRTVISNHTAHLCLPGISDLQTLENVSRKIGSTSVERTSTNHDPDGRRSRSRSWSEVELAPPEWIRQLGPDECIALVGRFKPMRLRIPGWFDDDRLRQLVDPEVAARFDAMYQTGRRQRRAKATVAAAAETAGAERQEELR